jgi:hypothetical protein
MGVGGVGCRQGRFRVDLDVRRGRRGADGADPEQTEQTRGISSRDPFLERVHDVFPLPFFAV